MQKREYLILSLFVFAALFLIIGRMPAILADGNDSNNSGRGSDSINDSDDDSENDDNITSDTSDDDSDRDKNETDDDSDKENRTKIKTRELIREGNCTIKIEKEIRIEDGKRVESIKKKMKCADGTEIEVKIKIDNRTEDGRYRERIKYEFKGKEHEVEAEDGINISEDTNGTEYKLKAKLRNGNFTRIKVMPDTASEIALERLKALNFTIQLRERLDDRNIPRVVYNIEANKNGKFLGVFKLSLKVEGQIDPETGEFLGMSEPWWAFLVVQQDETATGGNETNSSG